MKLTIIFICLLLSTASAQERSREVDLSNIIEDLYGSPDNDISYEELYETLMQLLSHPLNLNTASRDELESLKILNLSQLQNLIAYRDESHGLVSVYELQAIPGLDLATIQKLLPFVKVPDPAASIDQSLAKRIRRESDNYLLVRGERTIERSRGFSTTTPSEKRFTGSAERIGIRFRCSRSGDFSIGFNMEKDAGEQINWKPAAHQYGFDFISGHAQLQNKGRLKNLIAGNFQIQQGQGLLFGGMLGSGKGSETVTAVRRSNVGLVPYTSMYEAGFLRGVGATFSVNRRIDVTSFISRVRRDAAIEADSTDTSLSSLQTSGLHRNATELENRQKTREIQYGTIVQYKTRLVQAGLMFHQLSLENPLIPTPTPYNQFAFEGRSATRVGAHIQGHIGTAAMFAEVAYCIGGGAGFVGGGLFNVTPALDMALHYRWYGKDFHALNSSALSESSTPQNESGLYWGWKYKFNKKFSLNAYVDLFKFPWLRYRIYRPSVGHEWLGRFTFQPARKVSFFIQAREERKDRNVGSSADNLYVIEPATKRSYSMQGEFELTKGLKMRSRVQFSTFHQSGRYSNGFVIMQDLNAVYGKFQVTARYALFDTDDYDNRQYAYENDVLLAYSMPAYFGQGVRKMIMVRYKINRYLSIWLRYASTRYEDQENSGSGYDTIAGNRRNDIKFQLRILF